MARAATALLAAAALFAVSRVAALEMKVDAAVKECLFEEVSRGNKLTGSFEVLSGGMHDIDATVSPPYPLHGSWRGRGRSARPAGAATGRLVLALACRQGSRPKPPSRAPQHSPFPCARSPALQIRGPNDQEMWAVRQRSQAHFHVVAAQDGLHSICFENRLSSRAVKTVAFSIHVGDDVFKELAQHEHLTPLEQEISQLADNLQTVVDEQHYYWSRERRHRDTSESTNARVLWFSVAETLVILAMAGWQFWSLRAFISKTLTF